MSLYNKYRPNNFNQLIKNKFTQNLENNPLSHHAYLFFGPPGTGKTSSARLCMTKYVEGEKAIENIINGKHPDYYEVNCAVNNGVDDIRQIVSDVVNTVPTQSKYKFIIFDESHMLTTQAQNALLKTVEEPPQHVKFFFCTTEINKVLPAIRSRCQITPFVKLTNKQLTQLISTIAEKENYAYNADSISLIANSADGSARNAINLLEQSSAVLNDADAVAQILGTASTSNFYKLTKYIFDKKPKETINLVEEIFDNAIDPNSVMNKYADYIAELIIQRVNNPQSEFEGKKLLLLADCVTNILKDFKVLQNIKLISKMHIMKLVQAI